MNQPFDPLNEPCEKLGKFMILSESRRIRPLSISNFLRKIVLTGNITAKSPAENLPFDMKVSESVGMLRKRQEIRVLVGVDQCESAIDL